MKNFKIIVALMIICVMISAVACVQTKECEHADANLDHKCDLCSEAMGECADADKDHKCDYGCDKTFGTHEAADGSHSCAYCGAKISECTPAADDGDCTTAVLCTVCEEVCTPAKSAHEAAADDGNCTTAVKCVNCDKNAVEAKPVHEAAEGAHGCQYCDVIISDCADDNNDHNCDVCGKKLSDCADNNNDHNCDVCGKKLSDCADDNNDHNCDVCGKKLSDCADNNNDHNCDVCDKALSTCEEKYDEGKITTSATCTEKGVKTYTCTVCGGTKTEEIASTGHKDVNGDFKCDVCKIALCTEHQAGEPIKEKEVPATCKAAGSYESVVKCSVCGEELSRTTVALDKLDHTPAAAVEEDKVDSTCSAEGSYNSVVYCSVCNEKLSSEAKTIDKKPHTEVVDKAVDATCTEAGKTEGKHCSVCNEVLVAQNAVAALGHKEVTVAGKAATCTETGLKDGKKCSVCGVTTVEQEVIPVAAHSFASALIVEGAKTEYESGESFDTANLTVKLDCANCDYTEAVSDYTLSKTDNLQVEDTQITVSYVKDGVTYTASVQITVELSADMLYPTEGEREVNILYKGDTAYSFMAVDAAGNTDRAAAKGWFTPTVGTNLGLPTLMNTGANQYLQFNKTAQIELFFNRGSDGNTYHIFDNKTNWGAAAAEELFNKEYTYEFEVSANGAFVLSVCDFRTNMGMFTNNTDLYGIDFLFDGNTIKMSRCSSGKVEAIATIEGVDFGDGTTRKISFAITRLDLDNGQIRVFVDEEKAMFEATADYGSTTVSTNPTPGGTVVNGTMSFPDACKYGQRFTVAPQALGDGYSTVNIYSYKKLFVKNYTEAEQCTVTLDGGLKFTDGTTSKVVDKYYDVFANVDLTGYQGLYNVNTGSIFYGLITADVTLGGYVKDANDVIPTLQQLANKNETGLASQVTKLTNYIVAGRVGTRVTYDGEFTKDYKIRFCNTLANGQRFTGGVTYVSTFTIKNYSDKQLSFTLYEITSGHTLTNFKAHVDLAPGESGTYTIEWSFASANNMLPFIVFDNDHTGDNAGFDFGIALNVVEKK